MQMTISRIALIFMPWLVVMIESSNAFVPSPSTAFRRTSITSLRGGADDNPINSGELVFTLAKLDQQWKIQQSQPNAPKSRWTKIFLDIQDSGSVDKLNQELQDYVYVLEPLSEPSSIIVFLGGAGLGQFPHIAYNELLVRVSDRLNAVIIAAPYTVGLDHFAIAKQAGEKLRKGIIAYQEEKKGPQNLPIYCFGHSLGCKLQSIYLAATSMEFKAVGFLAFNNFSFSQTIGMARQFADQLRQSMTVQQNSGSSGVLNQLFDLAETAVGAIGLDFSPTPHEMRRLIQLKYAEEWKPKTRLFCFDDDTLDSTQDFMNSSGQSVLVSALPGNHLTPVFLQFKMDDYVNELPEEAKGMASQAMNGFQGFSFGDEGELNLLVDEICRFISGKPPSRQPANVCVPVLEGNTGPPSKDA